MVLLSHAVLQNSGHTTTAGAAATALKMEGKPQTLAGASPQLLHNRLVRQRLPHSVHSAPEGPVGKEALQRGVADVQGSRRWFERKRGRPGAAGVARWAIQHDKCNALAGSAPRAAGRSACAQEDPPAARCSHSRCCPGSSAPQVCCGPAVSKAQAQVGRGVQARPGPAAAAERTRAGTAYGGPGWLDR